MNEIKSYLKEKNILWSDILIQLKKDLSLSGISSDYLKKVKDEESLVYYLTKLIENLLIYHPDLFHNLLYRIDISERKINEHVRDNVQLELAELILKREAVKIYYRKKFNS
jgi:hypothetical protein